MVITGKQLVLTLSILSLCGARVHFTGFGDWGNGSRGLKTLVSTMNKFAKKNDFVLLMGDNFYGAGEAKGGVASVVDSMFTSLFANIIAKDNNGPFHPSLGNYDYFGNVDAQVAYSLKDPRWDMPSKYYLKRYERNGVTVCVITLDTNTMKPNDEQLQWLDKTLGSDECNTPNAWRVVTGHHPIYSSLNIDDDTPNIAPLALPILHKHKVLLYLCGHEHLHTIFYDEEGLTQVTSGSSALRKPKVKFSPHTLQIWGLSGSNVKGYVDVVATKTKMRVKIVCARNGQNYQEFTIPRNGGSRESVFGHIKWSHTESNKDKVVTALPMADVEELDEDSDDDDSGPADVSPPDGDEDVKSSDSNRSREPSVHLLDQSANQHVSENVSSGSLDDSNSSKSSVEPIVNQLVNFPTEPLQKSPISLINFPDESSSEQASANAPPMEQSPSASDPISEIRVHEPLKAREITEINNELPPQAVDSSITPIQTIKAEKMETLTEQRSLSEGDSTKGDVPQKKELSEKSVVAPVLTNPAKKEKIPMVPTGEQQSSGITNPKHTIVVEPDTKPDMASGKRDDVGSTPDVTSSKGDAKPKMSNSVHLYPNILMILLFALVA